MSKCMGPVNTGGRGFPAGRTNQLLSRIKFEGRIPANEMRAIFRENIEQIRGLFENLEKFNGTIEIASGARKPGTLNGCFIEGMTRSEMANALRWLSMNPEHKDSASKKKVSFKKVLQQYNRGSRTPGRKMYMRLGFYRVDKKVHLSADLYGYTVPQLEMSLKRNHTFVLPDLNLKV
ncbi:hypothetical protein ACFLZ2_05575 [Candidatus Margulisiibacteriota bacterium]